MLACFLLHQSWIEVCTNPLVFSSTQHVLLDHPPQDFHQKSVFGTQKERLSSPLSSLNLSNLCQDGPVRHLFGQRIIFSNSLENVVRLLAIP